MNYLLDKKIKRRKINYIIFSVIFLFVLFYFRSQIFNGLTVVSSAVFRPVLILGNFTGEKLRNLGSYFASKNSLYVQNEKLTSQLSENMILMANYDSVVAENNTLKELLGRKKEKTSMILSTILSKPSQSPYDTLIIDVGAKQGIKTGDMVFALGYNLAGEALGTVPIGRVSDVYGSSSKVILLSNAGEKTNAIISTKKDVFMEIVGRGGGNFEMIIPRNLSLIKGDQVVLPGMTPYVLGIVETVISDPRDPFTKALLISPVNIQELKFVEVELK